jgi:hypothetical protein
MPLSSVTHSWVKLITATLRRTTFSIKMQKNVIQLNGMKKHVIQHNAVQMNVVQCIDTVIVMSLSSMILSSLLFMITILIRTTSSWMTFSIVMSGNVIQNDMHKQCHAIYWQQNTINQYNTQLSEIYDRNTHQNNIWH